MKELRMALRKAVIKPDLPGKELKKLDAASYKKLLGERKPRFVTEETLAASQTAHDKAAAANVLTLQKLAKGNPALLTRALGNKDGKPPAPAASPTHAFKDRKGKLRTTGGVHRDAMVRDILVARALRVSRKHQAELYARAYGILAGFVKKNPTAAQKFAALPKAWDTSKVKVGDVDVALGKLVDVARDVLAHFDVVSGGPTAPDCRHEEGTGAATDMTDSGAASTFAATGLMKNKSFPLKPYLTCVRHQGTRGTCPSFSITAAVETAVAVQTNRFVNLSEQDLYKKMRHDWFPFDDYDDGYAPPVSLLFQMTTGYRFPFEKDWDYNPSWSRVPDDPHRTYTHSCDSYGNPNCSDTNHQSHQTTYQIPKEVQKQVVKTVSTWVEDVVTVVEDVVDWFGSLVGVQTHTEVWGHWVEKTVTETVTEIVNTTVTVYDTDIAGTSNIGVTAAHIVWDGFTNVQAGISMAKLLLAAKIPLVYCFYAMPSFDGATGNNGYVTFMGANEPPHPGKQVSDLGHCVMICGFVENADLPAGAPQGAGGGYFIVKNSWGQGYGDCGFCYLPYDWVTQWGTVMCAIDAVTA